MNSMNDFVKMKRPLTPEELLDEELIISGVAKIRATQKLLAIHPSVRSNPFKQRSAAIMLESTLRMVETKLDQAKDRVDDGECTQLEMAELMGSLKAFSQVHTMLLVAVNSEGG